ncbi:MAG: hypothetical protein K8T25_14885 [Planctomycetia bacterium]|nr:hypothetical protein [Planctomycetia bacterium]
MGQSFVFEPQSSLSISASGSVLWLEGRLIAGAACVGDTLVLDARAWTIGRIMSFVEGAVVTVRSVMTRRRPVELILVISCNSDAGVNSLLPRAIR